ncbi:MAG: MoxR family ATPase [Planctomycetes bacterium]|nr:MoxR family ATPase [Planctomycetota bacterium]MBI3846824.1 MoxR family ATPase [Planctomycetota bacterium]
MARDGAPSASLERLESEVRARRAAVAALEESVRSVIVGQQGVIREVLLALLAGGHTLLEGVPGLGKTLLIRTIAQSLDLEFSRIQFTPDLMPADIIGTMVIVEDERGGREFRFQKGPIFGNIILADEINRATPKTQSALLEAMEESSVTVARTTHRLTAPFYVLATQNPLEMEGTYPLPEAQLDRFLFKVQVKTGGLSELTQILDRTTGSSTITVSKVAAAEDVLGARELVREIVVSDAVKEMIGKIVLATHPESKEAPDAVKRFVKYGASPRGAQAIALSGKALAFLKGRYNVAPDDVREVARPALRHRLLLNFEGEAEGVDRDDLVRQVLERVS